MEKRGNPFKKALTPQELTQGDFSLFKTWYFQMYWYGLGGKVHLWHQLAIDPSKITFLMKQVSYTKGKKPKVSSKQVVLQLLKINKRPGQKGGCIIAKVENLDQRDKYIAWAYYPTKVREMRLPGMKKFKTFQEALSFEWPSEPEEGPLYSEAQLVKFYKGLPSLKRVSRQEIPAMWKYLQEVEDHTLLQENQGKTTEAGDGFEHRNFSNRPGEDGLQSLFGQEPGNSGGGCGENQKKGCGLGSMQIRQNT